MKFGVVIVTFNRLKLLKICIEHCMKQTIPFEKIIIVNNCSTDGTFEYLQSFSKLPNFFISNQDKNRGGAGGFKRGLEIAESLNLDWILIIDDDAIINLDYIECCSNYISTHPNICAVSGTVVTEEKIQLSHRRRIKNKLLFLESNVPILEYTNNSFRYDLATFCGLMISGRVLKKIGMPKEEYFIWFDDTEFSMRLQKFGKIVNINSAQLDHRTVLPKGEKSGFFSRMCWKTYYGHRNRLDAVKHHFGRTTQLVILTEFIIFIICGKGMQIVPKFRRQGKFVVSMLKDAMLDGYKGNLGKNSKYSP